MRLVSLVVLCLAALAAGPARAQGTPPPEMVEVDRQPVPVYQPEPEYPAEAREAGIEGRVTLRVWVGRTGRVQKVQVLRSDNVVFNDAATGAVRRWTFEPAMKDGRPVDVWVTVPIRFRTNAPDAPASDAVATTWDAATRTFGTTAYEMVLPDGFPRPGLIPGSDSASIVYASELDSAGIVVAEVPLPPSAYADTSLATTRELARLMRAGMLDEVNATSMSEPEEIVTPERFVSRMTMTVEQDGDLAYSLLGIVLPRRGTGPVIALVYASPDSTAPRRPDVLRIMDSFRYRTLTIVPFRPADPFALLGGTWRWDGLPDEETGGPFTLTVAEDRQTIRLDYLAPIEAPDGSMRASFTYRVLGHDGAVVRTQMEGETRTLATGAPIGWHFVLRSNDEFCWRQADLPDGTCTRSIVRMTGAAR